MKLTIVKEDGAVYIDGISFLNLDLSTVPQNVHALQFNDTVNKGWIEFIDDDFGIKPNNEYIEELPVWATEAINKWNEAKDYRDSLLMNTEL
jgi:hypothetical protein